MIWGYPYSRKSSFENGVFFSRSKQDQSKGERVETLSTCRRRATFAVTCSCALYRTCLKVVRSWNVRSEATKSSNMFVCTCVGLMEMILRERERRNIAFVCTCHNGYQIFVHLIVTLSGIYMRSRLWQPLQWGAQPTRSR